MGKVHQWLAFTMLVYTIGMTYAASASETHFYSSETTEVKTLNTDHNPFSIPQNSDSNAQNQSAEEDITDDDDQVSFMHHSSNFNAKLVVISHYPHLAFNILHHEVVTPPPQF